MLEALKEVYYPQVEELIAQLQQYAEELYRTLQAQGVEVIFDDRKERPGVMFADMELIGVPHMVVIGEKNLANGEN